MGAGQSRPEIPPDKSPLAKKMSAYSRFWISQAGRTTTKWVSVTLLVGYFTGYVALHTWFLPQYKDTVQLYKNGFMTPLTPDVFERAKSALADIKLPEKEKQSVKFFTVYGMDLFYAGSTALKGGVIIGIPRNYSYKSKDDVERRDIIVDGNCVPWSSEGGELLEGALVLSENAQKFGIAREICMTDTHYVYVRGALGSFAGFLYYVLSINANEMLYGLYKPRSFRVVVYSALALFCFGIWAVSTDILTKYYENSADKRVGSINPLYARGGVEFYSKTLQRNIALRSIMGPTGEKMYTFFGNDVEFIRERHVPFTKRKHNLEKLAAKLAVGGNVNADIKEDVAPDPQFLKS